MKASKISILTAVAACTFTACFASDNNTLDQAQKAREAIRGAFDAFAAARNLAQSAGSVYSGECYALAEKRTEMRNIGKNFANLENSSAELARNIADFKTKFAADVESFKSAKSTLEGIEKFLPLARAKIKSAETLISQMREKVAQNPGNNYQDKREFESVQSAFFGAQFALDAAERELTSTLVNISVATPKIEGIAPALKLADDYAAKLEKLNAENGGRIAEAKKPLEKLSAEYAQSLKALTSASEKINKSRGALMVAYGKLANFVLNKLPEIDANAQLPRMSIFSRLYGVPTEFAQFDTLDITADRGGSVMGNVFKRENAPMARKARSGYATNLAAAPAAEQADATSKAAQNVRAEILADLNKVADISFEIREAANFLNAAKNEAASLGDAIDADVALAQNFSAQAIQLFSQAQAMQSSLQMAETSNKVLQSRREIFKAKFDGQLKSADEAISLATEKAEAAGKILDKLD